MMETALAIGNTSTLATLNNNLGKKCFAFIKLDPIYIAASKSRHSRRM